MVLCSKIKGVAQTSCPEVLPDAAIKFEKAFTLFSKCHKGYNGGVVSDTDICNIGKYLHFE